MATRTQSPGNKSLPLNILDPDLWFTLEMMTHDNAEKIGRVLGSLVDIDPSYLPNMGVGSSYESGCRLTQTNPFTKDSTCPESIKPLQRSASNMRDYRSFVMAVED